jgi:cytochrome c553
MILPKPRIAARPIAFILSPARRDRAAAHPCPEDTMRPPLATLALALAAVASAHAQAPDPNLGRDIAATCANCHGTNGASLGTVPSLAGQPRQEIIARMKDFKAGTRQATIMHQLAKGYTDDQLELAAAFLAAQPAP